MSALSMRSTSCVENRRQGVSSSGKSHENGMFVFDAKPSTGAPEAAPAPVRGEDSEIKALRDRVRALESALATSASGSFSRQCGPGVDREEENRDDDDIQPLAENCFRRKNGKTRFYGRSHWILTMSHVSAFCVSLGAAGFFDSRAFQRRSIP